MGVTDPRFMPEPCATPDDQVDPEQAARELAKEYGLGGEAKKRLFGLAKDRDVNYFVTRAMDMAFAMRKHPVGRKIVHMLLDQGDRARSLAEYFGRRWERLVNEHGGVEGKAFGEFHEALMDMDERKEWPTNDELVDLGLSRPARLLFQEYRRLMPKALMLINVVRKAHGLEPIAGIQGVFFPHEMNGNYRMTVDGARYVGPRGSAWDTQADALDAAYLHMRMHPEDVGKVAIVADYKSRMKYAILGDPSDFADLNETLSAVSRGSSLSEEDVAEAYRKGLTKSGFKTHLLPRKGRPGYDQVNVGNVIQRYFNALPWWASAEWTKVRIRDSLAGQLDPAREPHTVRALQRFIAQVYGLPGGVEIAFDQLINKFIEGPTGQAIGRLMQLGEAVPLVRPVARKLNPLRFSPTRPSARLSHGARAITGDLKMGLLNIGVMTTHLMHLPTNVWPTVGSKYFVQGLHDAIHMRRDMRAAYNWGEVHGVFKASLLDDAPGGPLSRAIERATRGRSDLTREVVAGIWRPIGVSERLIRQATFFGVYRALKDKGHAGERLLRLATDDTMKEFPELGKYNERYLLEVTKRATEIIANRYDRASRPWWTTGAAGGLVGQFKSFIPNTIALEKRLWDLGGTENRARALAPLGVMMALGGMAGGIPFAHQLDDAWRFITSGLDPEGKGGTSPLDSLYMTLRHDFGRKTAELIYRGIPALAGIDATRRVGFSHLHLEGPKDIAGAFFSTLIDAMLYLHFHDLEHAGQIAPGLGNAITAFEWQQEMMAKDQYHRERLRFTPHQSDIWKRVFGWEPLRQAQTTDIERITGRYETERVKSKAAYVDQMLERLKAKDTEGYRALQEEAIGHDILITPEELQKELETKRKPTLQRRYESLQKADRPWFLKEFGPELREEQKREGDAARALAGARGGAE